MKQQHSDKKSKSSYFIKDIIIAVQYLVHPPLFTTKGVTIILTFNVLFYNQKWIFHERMLNGHPPSSKPPQIYSAYGICIISKHPYYNTLKDCLSRYGQKSGSSDIMSSFGKTRKYFKDSTDYTFQSIRRYSRLLQQ